MTKEQALEQIKKLSQELTAKFKAGVFDAAAYSAAYNKLNDALYLLNHDKSPDTVIASVQSVKDMLSGGMTQEEYNKQKSAMYKKYKAGEITNYAYIQWKKQNNPANKLQQAQSGAVSAPATAKAQTPAPKNAASVAAKNAGKTAEDILGFKIPDLISDTTNYTNILVAALNGGTITQAQYDQAIKKVIAGSKKWQKQNAAPKAMTHDEYIKLWEELNKQKKAGKLTPEKYKEYGDSLDAMYAQKATLDAAKQAIHMVPMTGDEMLEIGKQLSDKYNAGKITWDEFNAMNDTVMNMKAQNATLADVQAAVGLDPGSLAKEKAIDDLEAELKDVYGQAAKEMQKAWDDFSASYAERLNKKYQDYQDGKITKDEYDEWVKGQMAKSDQMLAQIDQLTGVVSNANKKALGMINGEQLGVFAENANWQAYKLTKDANMNLTFAIYDEHTVEKLIRDKPELLPRKQLNGKKDAAWNQDKIAKSMVQGILQGESIPKLARRVAIETAGTNMNAMVRYARTAMVAAQNSGRMEMLHRAEGMGIKCKKCWLATLDSRTRDSHQQMDGVKVDIDKKFPNGLMYPGDPNGNPAEVWNCRCTLTYEYDGFPADPANNERRDNESGGLIADMDYQEWKAAKKGSELNNLNIAKVHLAEVQKSYVKNKVSETKKYEGIWKEPVTLADYPDKKASIAAKRDYYDQEIQKYEDAQANGASWATDEKIKELKKKLKQLNEFELNGGILEKRNAALKAVQDIYDKVGYQKKAEAPGYSKTKAVKKTKKEQQTPTQTLSSAGAKATPFSPDAYSKERKDKALWTTDKRKVDDIMRKKTGEMWLKASREERIAIHEYTYTYKKFNEPLRGIEYGTSRYLGVGKTDLNAGSKRSGRKLNAITDLLDRCSYDHDMWLNRGVRFGGMDKFFNVPMSLLENGTESQLQKALIGTTPTEYAFGSMGSAKGEGFSGDIIMNIYAPKGTKMLFAEPWSYYGRNKNGVLHEMEGAHWNGKDTQPSYGTEFETILQQGTQFRVTKVTRRGKGTIFVDMEVINQDNQQRWKP